MVEELNAKRDEMHALHIIEAENWAKATDQLREQHEAEVCTLKADSKRMLDQSVQERHAAVQAKDTEIQNMKEKATLERHNFDMQIASAKAEHAHAVQMLEATSRSSEERLKLDFQHALATSKTEIEALREKHDDQLQELQNSMDKENTSMREVSETKIQALETQLTGIDSSHQSLAPFDCS